MVVIDRSLGSIIGSSRFRIADPAASRAEIGWSFLARSHWGGRTNREVKKLLQAHAFRFVEVVCFRVAESNARTRRAMEKIGGRLTGATEVLAAGPDGSGITHVVFEISKTDFAGQDPFGGGSFLGHLPAG